MLFSDNVEHLITKTQISPPAIQGVLTRVVGLTLEAGGIHAPIGTHCDLIGPTGMHSAAEVIGFSQGKLLLMPFKSVRGIAPGFRVVARKGSSNAAMSNAMLGRVIDGMGHPLDGGDEIVASEYRQVTGVPINPMDRNPIEKILDVGVRAINGLMTIGQGQRLGLMAGSGVGKSVLLGMMTRFTEADIVVIGLIGERGREVQEFVTESLGEEGLRRSVVVAAPGDVSPVARLNGAMLATTIAEYFRDQGKNVLLLMDSITRVAHAQREIGLAVGEAPATKGYPPSVFTLLPSLIERAGNHGTSTGSITAFYTVLAEGDDQQDPIVDAARAILDGHISLSRDLAARSHYPAIDVDHSISRLMSNLLPPPQLQRVMHFRKLLSIYHDNSDLINIGAYQAGTNPELDSAIQKMPVLNQFLQQDMNESVTFDDSMSFLFSVTDDG